MLNGFDLTDNREGDESCFKAGSLDGSADVICSLGDSGGVLRCWRTLKDATKPSERPEGANVGGLTSWALVKELAEDS